LQSYCGPEVESTALLKIPARLPFEKGGDLDIDFPDRLTATLRFAAAAGLPPD
jgi:hypothetical protein